MNNRNLMDTNTSNSEALNRIKQATKTYMFNLERGRHGRAKRGKCYLLKQINEYVVESFVSSLGCVSELQLGDKEIFMLSDEIINRNQIPYHMNFKRGVNDTKIIF